LATAPGGRTGDDHPHDGGDLEGWLRSADELVGLAGEAVIQDDREPGDRIVDLRIEDSMGDGERTGGVSDGIGDLGATVGGTAGRKSKDDRGKGQHQEPRET